MLQTDSDTKALVSGGYASFAAGDITDVLSRFAPDVIWSIPGPQAVAGDYRGPEGAASFFGKLMEVYSRLEVRPQEILELDDDRVLALGQHDGQGAGGSFKVGFAHVWQVRDGKVTSFVEYTDTEALGRAIG
jgi:ketosteroid isomerase-like protein